MVYPVNTRFFVAPIIAMQMQPGPGGIKCLLTVLDVLGTLQIYLVAGL